MTPFPPTQKNNIILLLEGLTKANLVIRWMFYGKFFSVIWSIFSANLIQNVRVSQGSRNIRKSAKVVTMSLEGPPPHRQLVTAWGAKLTPPSSDSLGVGS